MGRIRRLRRVLILCSHSARNLAFYRAGWHDNNPRFGGEFGKTIKSNFFDICILEWCKLFAEPRAPHCWRKVVTDAAKFERALFQHLACDAATFESLIEQVRSYRDKFVAHLDNEERMRLPKLDLIQASLLFYDAYILKHQAMGKIPDAGVNLEAQYAAWFNEAVERYARLGRND